MDVLNITQDVIDGFMESPKHVSLSKTLIGFDNDDIRKAVEEYKHVDWGMPESIDRGKIQNNRLLIGYELIAGSINYCYWYGSAIVRPGNASSTKMYELLDTAFKEAHYKVSHEANIYEVIRLACNYLIEYIMEARFPMIRERTEHIKQVRDCQLETLIPVIEKLSQHEMGGLLTEELVLNYVIKALTDEIPGYGEDIFLKRAFLLIMMLYRRVGMFENIINVVPVPADYQIPKILTHKFHYLSYSAELEVMIEEEVIIPKGSLYECEIRAATIKTCQMLAQHLGCNQEVIDSVLWLSRKDVSKPFHLTVTTDY